MAGPDDRAGDRDGDRGGGDRGARARRLGPAVEHRERDRDLHALRRRADRRPARPDRRGAELGHARGRLARSRRGSCRSRRSTRRRSARSRPTRSGSTASRSTSVRSAARRSSAPCCGRTRCSISPRSRPSRCGRSGAATCERRRWVVHAHDPGREHRGLARTGGRRSQRREARQARGDLLRRRDRRAGVRRGQDRARLQVADARAACCARAWAATTCAWTGARPCSRRRRATTPVRSSRSTTRPKTYEHYSMDYTPGRRGRPPSRQAVVPADRDEAGRRSPGSRPRRSSPPPRPRCSQPILWRYR